MVSFLGEKRKMAIAGRTHKFFIQMGEMLLAWIQIKEKNL